MIPQKTGGARDALIALALVAGALAGCANTDSDADGGSDASGCTPGAYRCSGTVALRCAKSGQGWVVDADCKKKDLVCTSRGCRTCEPKQDLCQGTKLLQCNADGSGFLAKPKLTCNADKGEVCHRSACANACKLARESRSYVGCEYWAVDLDNAVVDSGSAAAQQFAVALSNPSILPAHVEVKVDDAKPGDKSKLRVVKKVTVKPRQLQVIQLAPREVDGSPAGKYNEGTDTALSNRAYKIESSAPIIAYQFNPLSNEGVFSNDASLLLPTAALSLDKEGQRGASYRVMGWPQTIATTSDPKTNFKDDLRAFLAIVGTRKDTNVKIKLATAIVSDGSAGRVAAKKKGDELRIKLQPFQVLNLETGGFGSDADFTGTLIDTDKPVAVFSGSEASDVPAPKSLATRYCCADHLEQQLFPVTTFGKTFVAMTTPARSKALQRAKASIKPQRESEYFRILATGEFGTVTTTLAKPHDRYSIAGGKFIEIEAKQDFIIQSTIPVAVGQFVASQAKSGVPSTLPGGDPAFVLLPPVEQFRKDYLFLTPDKYAFDFILVAAPKGAKIALDKRTLASGCNSKGGSKICCDVETIGKARPAGETEDIEYVGYKCQLSFPEIVSGPVPPDNVKSGTQNDGVHRLSADKPIGLVVYGFDAFVSYGYPGGTDLALINVD